MAEHSTQYELRQRSIRLSQLVGEPQEQVDADWVGPSLQRTQSNETKDRPRLSRTMKLHRSSSSGNLGNGESMTRMSSAKMSPKLKLPSFEKLGISGHRFDDESRKSRRKGSRSDQEPNSYFQRSPSRSHTSPTVSFPYSFGSMPLLTPPEDVDSLKWNGAVTQANISAPEGTYSYSGRIPTLFTSSFASHTQSSTEPGSSRPVDSRNDRQPVVNPSQPPIGPDTNEDGQDWLNKAIQKTVESANSSSRLGQSTKVVSQAQPCPSDQASQPGSVFQLIVNEISNQHGSTHTPNIEIFHAVPQDFSLRNLPTSPPTTPNASIEGDYFTSQIFGSATVIQPHHNHNGTLLAHRPSISTFVRPPSSVTVTILERLIPPASVNEYNDMFSVQNSALADRLIELSPHGGSIIFIYPTDCGGQSFRDDLLSPILDPLLRNIVNLNSLYTDLGASLGRLSSVSSMLSFSDMVKKLQSLCRTISEQAYPRETRSRFELLYAGKGNIPLPRELWTELFIKQERPRLRELLEGYWSRGRRLPKNTEVTSATLLREIIDGLERRPYGEGSPDEEVEVGAFVIRRSLA